MLAASHPAATKLLHLPVCALCRVDSVFLRSTANAMFQKWCFPGVLRSGFYTIPVVRLMQRYVYKYLNGLLMHDQRTMAVHTYT